MCGFGGVLGSGPRIDETLGNLNTIRHRGPDGLRLESGENYSIGFVRLAIRGINSGDQPFVNPEKTVITVVNGEIYNSDELRAELQALGLEFSGESDCEVVHVGFIAWGNEIFSRLRGMFAIAIIEPKSDRLTLCRDRLGKKPLYYRESNGEVWFGSEPKSIPRRPVASPNQIAHYLIGDGIDATRSVWQDLRQVEPAGVSEFIQGQRVHNRTYYQFPPWNPLTNRYIRNKAFEETLEQAVADRLISEVPIGLFLSSGVDSLVVAGLASSIAERPLTSYTLRFQGNGYDESTGAEKAALKLGIENVAIDASLENLAEMVFTQAALFDEPVNDPAILGELMLSERASQDVKVCLTGDGGDELLHGYQHLSAHKYAPQLKPFKQLLNLTSAIPEKYMGNKDGYFSPRFVLERFARGLHISEFLRRDIAWRGAFSSEDAINSLEFHDATSLVYSAIDNEANHNSNDDRRNLGAWTQFYLRTYLHNVILPKLDRSTMAYGLEARSPLLDQRLVDLVLRHQHPTGNQIHFNKRTLRTILARRFPSIHLPGRKHGMGVPTRELLVGPLESEFLTLLSKDFVQRQGVFSYDSLQGLAKELKENSRDLRKEAWGIFIFQLWWKTWIEPRR